MKIIYVNRSPWPHKSPACSFVTFNAKSFSNIGVHIDLIVGKGNNENPKKILKKYFGIEPSPNFQIHLFSTFKFTSHIFYLLATLKILFSAKRREVNAIITRDPGFMPYMVWLKKITGAVVFMECHNYFWEITEDEDMQKVLRQRKKYRALERKWMPKLDGIFCILSPMAELYRKHLPPEKVHVALPGTLPSDEFYEVGEKPIFHLGYIGSLQEQRDFETVFKALKKVKAPNVKLLIIGGREKEMPRLNQLIRDFEVEGLVEVTGWLTYAEVRMAMKKLSVGLVPMKDNLYNRALTAPMKILDYLSFRLPTLAADLPSAKEFLGEDGAGIFYRPGDADDLAQKIDLLAGDKKRRSQMSEQAGIQSDKISWDNRARRQVEIISQHIFR